MRSKILKPKLNKANVVRQGSEHLTEEEAVKIVLKAQKEIGLGIGLHGDLRKLSKIYR